MVEANTRQFYLYYYEIYAADVCFLAEPRLLVSWLFRSTWQGCYEWCQEVL